MRLADLWSAGTRVKTLAQVLNWYLVGALRAVLNYELGAALVVFDN